MEPIVVTTAIRARGIFHNKNGIEKKILRPQEREAQDNTPVILGCLGASLI